MDRVKLLEACDIDGKSIDKDVILDVKKSDGEKLIKSKKAEEVKNSETNNENVKKDEKKDPEQKQKEIKSDSKKEEGKQNKTDKSQISEEKKVEIKGTEDSNKDELEKERMNLFQQIRIMLKKKSLLYQIRALRVQK